MWRKIHSDSWLSDALSWTSTESFSLFAYYITECTLSVYSHQVFCLPSHSALNLFCFSEFANIRECSAGFFCCSCQISNKRFEIFYYFIIFIIYFVPLHIKYLWLLLLTSSFWPLVFSSAAAGSLFR